MRQRVEILVTDGGIVLKLHAAVYRVRRLFAAVNPHLMAAGHESGGKLFRKGFESAVVGRDAARAEESDAQSGRRHFYVRAVSDRDSMRAIFLGACLLTGEYWNQLAMYASSTRR